MLCHHGAEYQCRLGQRWPLRLTQCHRWCDNIPILRRLQSQWVGSVINKRSWWLSISLCFINFQANKNILTWSGKINWLGQVHSEFHANKCGFLVLGGISDEGLFPCLTFCFHQIVRLGHHLSGVSYNPVLSQPANWPFLLKIFEDGGESRPLRHMSASTVLSRK